jgi:hypothetical protein
VRLLQRAHRVEALRHCALKLGVRDVDLRIDHRDRHVGAPYQAVDAGNLQLVQDILRGISLGAAVAARGRRGIVGLLLQGIEVIRLRDGNELDVERTDDLSGAPPVGNAVSLSEPQQRIASYAKSA